MNSPKVTRDIVIKHMIEDKFYEDVLEKYLSNEEERNEFRQELWLILLEKDEKLLIQYYNDKCLKYIYIGIIRNQLLSSTSPWHKKFRKPHLNFSIENILKDNSDDNLENAGLLNKLYFNANQFDEQDTFDKVLLEKEIFEDKVNYIEKELIRLEEAVPEFKRDIIVFKMHFYDKLSYRQITKKTNIPTTSIFNYVNNIKQLLIKNKITI